MDSCFRRNDIGSDLCVPASPREKNYSRNSRFQCQRSSAFIGACISSASRCTAKAQHLVFLASFLMPQRRKGEQEQVAERNEKRRKKGWAELACSLRSFRILSFLSAVVDWVAAGGRAKTSAVDNPLLVVRGIGVRCTPYATPMICLRVLALLRAWPLMSLLK